ncbi:hypothetical protein OROHE_010419 [Orobanche hederae]
MVKNLIQDVEPLGSDSEFDEENDGAASSESDSGLDPTEFIIKPSVPPSAAVKKPGPRSGSKTQHQQLPSTSSGEECSQSESRSAPESDSDDSDPRLIDLAVKARGGGQKPNGGAGKHRSKPDASEPVTPAKSSSRKRAADGKESEATDTNNAKRSNKKIPDNSDKEPNADPRKQNFQRFFSEEDEIAVLKGMIGYANKYNSDPFMDPNAFREFVKADLQVDPTVAQLLVKMRKFKQKYKRNKRKEEAGRKCRSLKAHERRAYELSKHVWAIEDENGKKLVGNPRAASRRTLGKKKADGENKNIGSARNDDLINNNNNNINKSDGNQRPAGNEDLNSKLADQIARLNDDAGMYRNIPRIGAKLLGDENRNEGAKEWEKLAMAETEVYLKKLEVMTAKTKLVSDVLKSDNH